MAVLTIGYLNNQFQVSVNCLVVYSLFILLIVKNLSANLCILFKRMFDLLIFVGIEEYLGKVFLEKSVHLFVTFLAFLSRF